MPLSKCTPSRVVLCAAGPLILLGGCRSYEPAPLDLAAHGAAFAARTPSSEDLAEFARRLGEREAAPLAFDPADGLTLPEGEVVALFFNADLRIARLRAGAAAATADAAGAWEDPVFGFDAAEIVSGEGPFEWGATIGLTIPISGRLEVEKARARAEHRAELERVVAQEWALRHRLRRAWLECSAQRTQASLAADLLVGLDAVLAIVDRLERAGELPRTEARLLRVEHAERRSERRVAEARVAALEAELRSLMGLAPSVPIVLVPAAPAGLGAADEVVAEDGAPSDDPFAAVVRSPALAVARAEYEVAEEALRLEVRKQYPDVEIGGGYGEEDDERILFGVSIPLPVWNRNRQGIAEAEAQRAVARAIVEATGESLAARFLATRARLDAARARRVVLEDEIVPLLDEQERDARRIAELGQVDTLVLLESLTRQHDAKVELIDARLAESLAAIEIDEIAGPPPSPADLAPESPPEASEGATP